MTNLQRIRTKRGISQKELSVLSGIPIRTIQGYEQLKRKIDGAGLKILCVLCEILKCRVDELLEDTELAATFDHITCRFCTAAGKGTGQKN